MHVRIPRVCLFFLVVFFGLYPDREAEDVGLGGAESKAQSLLSPGASWNLSTAGPARSGSEPGSSQVLSSVFTYMISPSSARTQVHQQGALPCV